VKRHILSPVFFLVLLLILTGCTTLRVDRVNAHKDIDLSGEWNDTDIRLVSEDLIRSCLKGSWYGAYSKAKKRDPVIIVGRFSNMSSERIDTSIIVKKFEYAIVESQKIVLVAGSDERGFIRDERMDQQIFANPATAKALAMETGADFMLLGSVKTVTDSEGGKTVRTYYVSAQLVELETTRVVWLDESTIKKVISRSAYTW
jgi:PBP1b-binding outer membrane lipoprotein LpoB